MSAEPNALQLNAPLQSLSQVLENTSGELAATIQTFGHEMYSKVCSDSPSLFITITNVSSCFSCR